MEVLLRLLGNRLREDSGNKLKDEEDSNCWYLTEALLRDRIGDGDGLAPDGGALTLTGDRVLVKTGDGRLTRRGSKQGDRLKGEEDREAG